MNPEELSNFCREIILIAFKTITPWKKRYDSDFKDEREYVDGWNACLKEIKKNRKELLNQFDKFAPKK